MEGQTEEASGHPRRTDVLLGNGKHKKSKIQDLFYAGFKMLKESAYCRSGCVGMSHKTELNLLILIDTNMQKTVLRTKNS